MKSRLCGTGVRTRPVISRRLTGVDGGPQVSFLGFHTYPTPED